MSHLSQARAFYTQLLAVDEALGAVRRNSLSDHFESPDNLSLACDLTYSLLYEARSWVIELETFAQRSLDESRY